MEMNKSILFMLVMVLVIDMEADALIYRNLMTKRQFRTPLHFLNPFRDWFTKNIIEKPVLQKQIIDRNVVIVGAGASGLACALELLRRNITDLMILERSDAPGGRIRTDSINGFLLDRGFQVFIEGYPESMKLLDYKALELKQFLPGALVKFQSSLYTVSDPLRRPEDLFATVISPIGSIVDKLRIGLYSQTIKFLSIDDIWTKAEKPTESYLRNDLGLSSAIIDQFLTPFYQGIFLAPLSLQSSRMFEFVFKMFGQSSASLPAKGMGQVMLQLAGRLPPESLLLNSRVVALNGNVITCERVGPVSSDVSGSTAEATSFDVRFKKLVLAVDPASVTALLPPKSSLVPPEARSSICLYYALDGPPPVTAPILILNGDDGNTVSLTPGEDNVVVNNVCFPSQVSADYAPAGKSLASVTVVGSLPSVSDQDLDARVRTQLESWFPSPAAAEGKSGSVPVSEWRLLKIYRIPYAQPAQTPPYTVPFRVEDYSQTTLGPDLYVCGDYRSSATLNGALESGRKAAERLLLDLTLSSPGLLD